VDEGGRLGPDLARGEASAARAVDARAAAQGGVPMSERASGCGLSSADEPMRGV